MNNPSETTSIKRESIIDISGDYTDAPLTKARVITLVLIAAIVLFFTHFGITIGLESSTAGLGFGLVIGVVVMWASNQFHLVIGILLLPVICLLFDVIPVSAIQEALGTSPLLVMMSMFIVSMGAIQTNFTKRIAYFFLCKYGKKPSNILLAICLSTTIVSAFCADTATTIVMASICVGILNELNKNATKETGADIRNLGKSMMLCIPVFAILGGMSLISSSPGVHMVGLAALQGIGHDVTFGQWAPVGTLCAVVGFYPTFLIYKKVFKVDKINTENIDTAYFKTQLDALGKLTFSEMRWILLVVIMITTMITGVLSMMQACMLCAFLTICPFVGTVKPTTAMKELNLTILLLIGLSPIITQIFSIHNIDKWLISGMVDYLSVLPVFLLMLIICLIVAVLVNLFIGAIYGVLALSVATFGSLCISLGLNPSFILMPAMLIAAAIITFGTHTNMILTYNYGYWEMKDSPFPGALSVIVWTLLFTVVCYFVAPLAGIGIYL